MNKLDDLIEKISYKDYDRSRSYSLFKALNTDNYELTHLKEISQLIHKTKQITYQII
jgi:hypothetical protein